MINTHIFIKTILISILITSSLTGNVQSQGFLRTQGKKIVNNREEVILRGIGVGGWMLQEPYMLNLSGIAKNQQDIKARIIDLIGEEKTQTFYDAWLQNGVTREDVDFLASCGFNSIRLPMHYNLFTLPVSKEPVEGRNTWLEKGFALTDSLLSWCKANQIYLILDLHAAPGGQGNDIAISDADEIKLWQSEANKQKMIALWKKLAEHYVNEEWIGAYDIINEPNYGFQDPEDKNGLNEKDNAPLRQLMIDITKAIREVDKNHIIVISGNGWGNNYNGIFPLWDNNMVVSFHKYWNYNDENSIAHALTNRDTLNAPLWMSESGENSNVWHNDAIRLLEKNSIGWAWWTYKKMGLNCPMEIKTDENYKTLLDYWKGKGEKPSPEEAFQTLMKTTENYNIKNTIFHKDFTDALFRQVSSDTAIPFINRTLSKNKALTIFASDYDLGRSGVAYHDTDSANYRVSNNIHTTGNSGYQYRNDGVDIIKCLDPENNGHCVSDTKAGEWLQYTVDVEEAGKYTISVRTSSSDSSGTTGRLHFIINNLPQKETITVSSDAGKWQTSTINNISLKKGNNVIRLYIDNGGFDLNWIKLSK